MPTSCSVRRRRSMPTGCQNAKIEPVFDLRAQRFCVQADGRLLWRVFDNLLSNICKYGLPGSRAYLRTEERGELLRITFRISPATP